MLDVRILPKSGVRETPSETATSASGILRDRNWREGCTEISAFPYPVLVIDFRLVSRVNACVASHEHALAVLDLLDQAFPDAQYTSSSRGTAAVVKD